MTIERRMADILAETKKLDPKSETLPTPSGGVSSAKDIYARAAQVLVVGLHPDLPDDEQAATDYLVAVMQALLKTKRQYIRRAVHIMARQTMANALLRQMKKEQ